MKVKMKKNILRVLEISCLIAFMLIGNKLLKYVLIDDTNAYSRLTFHELYHPDKNVDVLFLGSSHCFRSINTKIADSIFGMNTFNAGTSSQYLDGSLAVLKEAEKYNDIKKIYVEMYYGQIGFEPENRAGGTTATYIISDYMDFSLNKMSYLLNATRADQYSNSFLPIRRVPQESLNGETIMNNILNKSTDFYQNFQYNIDETRNEWYAGKGFVNSKVYIEENTYGDLDGFAQVNRMSEYDIKNMQNMIDYCKSKDIELVFFSAPMSDFRLVSLENYDEYVKMMTEYCNKNRVKYYDFNLCKKEILPLNGSCFTDDNHLNGKGADLFSEIFSKVMTGETDVEDIFWDTYKNKSNQENNVVYGTILYKNEETATATIKTVTSNYMEGMRYTVYKQVEGSNEKIILQENSDNMLVALPQGEKGNLEIVTYYENAEVNHTNVQY